MNARKASLAAATLAVLLLAGCGGDDRTREFNDPVVSAAQVDRYPVGSPARRVMEMIRVFQYNVPTSVVRYIDPKYRLTASRLAPGMVGASRVLAETGPLRVVSVSRRGSAAVVRLQVKNARPLRVRVALIDGAWKFIGLSF